MAARRVTKVDGLSIERHGITLAFEAVPIAQLGDLLDQVFTQLLALEKIHDIAPVSHEQVAIGGYHEVPVPPWEDEDAWVGETIGFTRPAQ